MSGAPAPADLIEQTTREWTLGAYQHLAAVFLPIAARLVDAAAVGADETVLDVACGTGNVALTAARRGADVTGVDITPAMLEAAREQATIVDADVDWREGDAAALPFDADAFDVTLSCLGHKFVPDAAAAGDELVRVTRPGGRIGYAAWTPASGIAAMMGAIAEYLPDEEDPVPPPFLWGDPETVRERFGNRVAALAFETRTVMYPALSPAHFWHGMTTDSGGVMLAAEAVPAADRPAMREAVLAALEPYFSERDNGMELEYRLVTGTVSE